MTTFTVPAVYKDGVLKPDVKLDLPDNTPVQIEITTVSEVPTLSGSLFGAFPELAAIPDEALEDTQQAWDKGLHKQTDFLDGAA